MTNTKNFKDSAKEDLETTRFREIQEHDEDLLQRFKNTKTISVEIWDIRGSTVGGVNENRGVERE